MSNLANILTDAGFHSEAQEYLKKAQATSNPHTNAASSQVYLNDSIKSEEKKIEAAIDGKKGLSQFYGEAGQRVLQNVEGVLGKFWDGGGFQLVATVTPSAFSLKGTLLVPNVSNSNGFSGVLAAGEPFKYEIDIAASMIGLVVVGKMKRKKIVTAGSTSLFDWFSDESSFVAAIEPSGKSARCLMNDVLVNLSISDVSRL